MSPVSLIPILPILGLALTTVYLVNKVMPIPITKGHYAAIDGLRGYLAFFVFLHHSSIWYFFIRYNNWGAPPSHVYNHLGPTSVDFFFMITAFLFFRKLMKGRLVGMNWLQLYVARVFRIMPVYLFAMSVLFVFVGVISGFVLHERRIDLGIQMLEWLAFMGPDMNGVGATGLIIAGVVGSLAFEWAFYFSLAIIGGMFFNIQVSNLFVVCTGLLLLFFLIIIEQYYPHGAVIRVLSFGGGIVAAFLIDNATVRRLAVSKLCSGIMIILLITAIGFFTSVDSLVPMICVMGAFIIIACGNTLFGLLTNATSRRLGQISYSIFMLHGLLLFLTFRLLLGSPRASAMSAISHWMVIAIIGVMVILISSLTYHYIEAPFMNAASGVSARLENIFKKKIKAIKL